MLLELSRLKVMAVENYDAIQNCSDYESFVTENAFVRIRNETAESDRNVDGGLFSCVGIKSVGCFRRALRVTSYERLFANSRRCYTPCVL